MQVIGIVAEYNPFHSGHAYQIQESRRLVGADSAVVIVMSGNWVQQADCAIADKWLRAKMALMGGADLVLELPTVWATASAEGFARGAVTLLDASGLVDHLSFGSECGSTESLVQIARCLSSPSCQENIKKLADTGLPFAQCRQKAAEAILGAEAASPLARPNNNLGIEYIRSLDALHSSICPMTIQRRGAQHNGVVVVRDQGGNSLSDPTAMPMPQFVSATQLRMELVEGHWDQAKPYLVPAARALLEGNTVGLPGLERVERAILAKLRTMTAEDWARLPDSGQAEGLPQRLERAGRTCVSVQEFFNLVKVKRFTHARLRRLILRAYLGIIQAEIPDKPPYLRVLGINTRGRGLLRDMKERAALPILTKPAHARTLSPEGQRLFELESRCTDLYDLCFETVPSPGREWRTGPVVLEEAADER